MFICCYNCLAHGEQAEFPSAEHFNYLLDVLNNGSTSEDKLRHISTKYNDQDRYKVICIFVLLLDLNINDKNHWKVETMHKPSIFAVEGLDQVSFAHENIYWFLIWIFWLLVLTCNSQGLNLPESPFASAIGSGISTVI